MSSGRCPLCDSPLYGWITLPPASGEASVGLPLGAHPETTRVIDRCEECGVALEHGRDVDLVDEWTAVCVPAAGGGREVAVPNRLSLQASIGGGGWAAVDLSPGRLLHSPRSIELLAERNAAQLEPLGWPLWGRSQAWMWQTLLNGLTFHTNFAREVRARRLRPGTGRGVLAYAVDAVVTVLGAPFVAVISVPLEVIAAALRRGGELRVTVRSTAGRNGTGRDA